MNKERRQWENAYLIRLGRVGVVKLPFLARISVKSILEKSVHHAVFRQLVNAMKHFFLCAGFHYVPIVNILRLPMVQMERQYPTVKGMSKKTSRGMSRVTRKDNISITCERNGDGDLVNDIAIRNIAIFVGDNIEGIADEIIDEVETNFATSSQEFEKEWDEKVTEYKVSITITRVVK